MMILAIRNYKSEKMDFTEDDFLDIEKLIKILDEVLTGESDLTPEGKEYLESKMGYSNVAQQIFEHGGLSEMTNENTVENIKNEVMNIVPLSTSNFIHKKS